AVTVLLLIVGAMAAYDIVFAAHAHADDGGFAECGYNWSTWLTKCGGASKIRRDGFTAAIASALGVPIGSFTGSVLGSLPSWLREGFEGFGPNNTIVDGPPRDGAGPRPRSLEPGTDLPPDAPFNPDDYLDGTDLRPPWIDLPTDPFEVNPVIGDPGWLFGGGKPNVWSNGTTISVRAPDGTIVSAPLSPDGQTITGPWTYAGRQPPESMTPAAVGGEPEGEPGDGVSDWPDDTWPPGGELGEDPIDQLISDWLESFGDGDPSDWGDDEDPFEDLPPEPQGPQMPSLEDLTRRTQEINNWNWTAAPSPELAHLIDDLYGQMRAGKPFDANMLHQLENIEAMEGKLSGDRHAQIVDEQNKQGQEWLTNRHNQLQAEADAEKAANDALRQIEKYEDFIRKHIDDLPKGQGDAATRLIDDTMSRAAANAANGNMPTPEMIDRISRLTGSVWNGMQGASEGTAAAETLNAATAKLWEDLHRGAQVALTTAVAGGAMQMALGGMAGTGLTGSQLGASMLGFGAATGAANGYGSGETLGGRQIRPGLSGALAGIAKNTLPINLVSQVVEELNAKDGTTSTGGTVGRILLATLQDIGTVGGIGDVADTVTAMRQGGQALSAAEAGAKVGTGEGMPWRKPGEPLRPTDPQMPRNPTAEDFAFFQGKQQGQQMAEDFSDLVQKARQAERSGDQAAIAAAKQDLEQAAINIASNYNAKATLKDSSPTLQRAYSDAMEPIFQQATKDMVDNLNAGGMQIGGRAVRPEDFIDLRNAASKGSVPMDRDLALNEMRARQLADDLANMPKNPPAGSIDEFTKNQMQQQLLTLQEQATITRNGLTLNGTDANQVMQRAYNSAYQNITGQTAESAMQGITHAGHGEAYPDLNAIKNNLTDYPLNPLHAEATGAVTNYKALENYNPESANHLGLGSTPELQNANATLETARGVVKDINTKVLPAMETAGATPQSMQRMTDVKDYLQQVGKGQLAPSTANALAEQKFGTDVAGLAEQASSNLAAAVQAGPVRLPPPAPPVIPESLSLTTSTGITSAGMTGGQALGTNPILEEPNG
ncbi:MAG: hypothetical protein V7636_1661, partial [Actinomycetota bacterium]